MVKKQSLVFVKPGVMRLDEYEKDDEPSETEVLIDVAAIGICGSDLHWHLVGKLGPATMKDNSIMGHEASGTIIKVGSKVTHLKPGDRVSCEPCVPCWTCDLCRIGSNNLCSHAEIYRCGMGRTGFFRSTNVWPATLCHKLPDNVSLDEGALAEPISCCVWAVRRAKLEGNENILITGSGPIGIICLMIAKAFGAGKICVTDVNEKRLEIAKSLGADYIIKTDPSATPEQIATQVREKMSCAPTITIECSGNGTCINTGILVCPKGGRVVLVGLSSRPVTVDLSTACVRQVDLITVSRYNNTFPTAIDLIASGKINAKALISHLIDLDDYQTAFDALKNGDGVKILLIPKKN